MKHWQSSFMRMDTYESSNVRLYPYDGLMPVETELAWDTDPNIYKKTYYGSNHLTIRNSLNTEDALQNLLDGKFGPFFRTKKK